MNIKFISNTGPYVCRHCNTSWDTHQHRAQHEANGHLRSSKKRSTNTRTHEKRRSKGRKTTIKIVPAHRSESSQSDSSPNGADETATVEMAEFINLNPNTTKVR